MEFYQLLSRYYDRLFPAGEAQIAFLAGLFPAGARLVDVACGSGNYALALADRGYSVLGIELDEQMYSLARSKLTERCQFRQGNMLDLEQIVEPEVGGIYCIGNSIVHLENLTQVGSVLEQVYRLLTDGGTFVIQTVNYDRWFAKDWPGFKDIQLPEGVIFKRNYVAEGDYIRFEASLQDEQGGVHTSATRLLPISSTKLYELAKQVGFETVSLFGGFNGSAFEPSSPALVVVMRKS